MKRNFLWVVWGTLIGSLLNGCAVGPYVPRIRDVREERFDGDYWHQWFTLYDPANPASDCQVDRTGQRIDLNSDREIADTWRRLCRTTTDHDSRSGNN